MVARLEKHKDHETLIKSLVEMNKIGLKAILYIVGDGSKERIKKLTKDLGLKLKVMGELGEIYPK